MIAINTLIVVASDHTISGVAPEQVPPGEHIARIELREQPTRQLASDPFDVNALPIRSLGPWPRGVNLRREELYGDDGR